MESIRQFVKDKKVSMPYNYAWDENVWSNIPVNNEQERQLVCFALYVGKRCQANWNKINENSDEHPLPLVISSILNDINRSVLPILKDVDTFEKGVDFNEATIDLLSDFLFMQSKRRKLDTEIVLPIESLNKPEVNAAASAIQKTLYSIFLYKFAFDRVFFLEDKVSFSEDKVSLETKRNSFGESYQVRKAVNYQRDKEWYLQAYDEVYDRLDALALSQYDIVTGVNYDGGKPFFRTAPVFQKPRASCLAKIRGWVGTEYLFTALEERGLVDVVYAWDILHSLCLALVEEVQQKKSVDLVVADYQKTDLIHLLSHCIPCTRQRARKIIEKLTFSIPAKDGVWSRPLISIDKNFLKLTVPAILTADPVRFLQLQLGNHGESSARGSYFEQRCIEQITNFTNEWGEEKFKVLPRTNPIYRILGKRRNETDFVIKIGNNLVLCEAKSVGQYASSREYYHSSEGIMKGAFQLKIRKEVIETKIQEVAKHLCIGKEAVRVSNIIITNSIIFDGYELEDACVISLRSLIMFISKLSAEIKMRSADSLFEDFVAYVSNPPHFEVYNRHANFEKSMSRTEQIEIDFDICSLDLESVSDTVKKDPFFNNLSK